MPRPGAPGLTPAEQEELMLQYLIGKTGLAKLGMKDLEARTTPGTVKALDIGGKGQNPAIAEKLRSFGSIDAFLYPLPKKRDPETGDYYVNPEDLTPLTGKQRNVLLQGVVESERALPAPIVIEVLRNPQLFSPEIIERVKRQYSGGDPAVLEMMNRLPPKE